ncbi:MAG: RNA-processing protein [Euryarchaeota archaeon]|nr:RNA-processing protein [Euryarchaeota archaeon]
MEYLRIPKDRIGVLIGRRGEVKRRIERELKVKITVDREGMVTIENAGDEPLGAWVARDIVRAIARGMAPEKAMKLTSEDYTLELIDLTEYLRTPKALVRQKARIIGTGGKTRRYIESTTGTYVSVYGKSVAIIGGYDEVQIAREAVLMLVQGKPHSAVYRFLDRKARELKEKRMLSLWKPRL